MAKVYGENYGKHVWRPPGKTYWYFKFMIRGRLFDGPTHCTNRTTAEAFARKERAKVLRMGDAGAVTANGGMTVADAIELYMDRVGAFLHSEQNRDQDEKNFLRLEEWLGPDTPIAEISTDTVAGLVARRRADLRKRKGGQMVPISAATVNRTTVEILKKALFYARDIKQATIQSIEWKRVRLAEAEPRRRELSVGEELLVAQHMREDFRNCFRFALLTGIRRENFTELRWREVDWTHRQLNIIQKGGGAFNPQLSFAAQAILMQEEGRHGEFVFTFTAKKTWTNPKTGERQVKGKVYPITYNGFDSEFRRACARAGITDATIHDLRRTMGCRVTRTAGIAAASKAMGHGGLDITSRHYGHVNNEDERAALEAVAAETARAIEKLQSSSN